MSFKSDKIDEVSQDIYHDLNDINGVKNVNRAKLLSDYFLKSAKVSGLSISDQITVLKNVTLHIIYEGTSGYFNYKEKLEREKMENDLK